MPEPVDTAQQPMSLEEARNRFPPIWIIYGHPKDYPFHFVVRRWYGLIPAAIGCLCDTLVEARECAAEQGGDFPLGRRQGDDPSILEVWI
jgi:hypothetical protein